MPILVSDNEESTVDEFNMDGLPPELCSWGVCDINKIEPHLCPFKLEIRGDDTTECTCCPCGEDQCRMDI